MKLCQRIRQQEQSFGTSKVYFDWKNCTKISRCSERPQMPYNKLSEKQFIVRKSNHEESLLLTYLTRGPTDEQDRTCCRGSLLALYSVVCILLFAGKSCVARRPDYSNCRRLVRDCPRYISLCAMICVNGMYCFQMKRFFLRSCDSGATMSTTTYFETEYSSPFRRLYYIFVESDVYTEAVTFVDSLRLAIGCSPCTAMQLSPRRYDAFDFSLTM
jgi:hypothetical protein